jgi:hypothetical protein
MTPKQLTLPGIITAERFERALQHRFERALEFFVAPPNEESEPPVFGFDGQRTHGITEYVAWWLDGDTDNNLHR